MNISKDKLGTPDLKLAGLQIWIHSRQFPQAKDYGDGNWVNVTAHCGTMDADIWTQGSIIHLSEIESWLKQIELMYEKLDGKAELSCMEPNLFARMKIDQRGQVSLLVKITPDHMNQKHEFTFEIDQSYLPSLISELKEILKRFPVKDKERKSVGKKKGLRNLLGR